MICVWVDGRQVATAELHELAQVCIHRRPLPQFVRAPNPKCLFDTLCHGSMCNPALPDVLFLVFFVVALRMMGPMCVGLT